MDTNKNLPTEHQNVPIEHRGLHDFLYSSDNEHAATVTSTPALASDGTEVVPVETWCDRTQNVKVAGVYAVLDASRRTQYVGYSRNVLLALNSHVAQNGQQTCAFVRVQTFKFPKREAMEQLRDLWIEQLDSVPPGNSDASERWASTVGEAAQVAMSATERHAYEEKKLKMRQALADLKLSDELDTDNSQQRQKIEAAVNNDDWSSVIDSQTQETLRTLPLV
ncbi:MAG TPA: GIY-YIG nuclease family protein [Candidatus Obscuribacterales bacterium]